MTGAQTLSVERFRLLENDLTANTYGTIERDQNGEVAALIKVVTSETGFAFDAGMLGIVKTVQKTGEIWVYVPYGLQRITIAHQELGVLRDYYFPVPIEKARTYELRLNSGRPKTEEKVETIKSLTVTLENPMSNANIYVDGNLLGTGTLRIKLMALTEYKVEVRCNGYHSYNTSIRLEPDEEGKIIEIPALKPITATLKISSSPSEASVYIGGTPKGVTPMVKDGIGLGVSLIDIKKKGYHRYSTSVNVTEDKTYNVDAVLKEIKYLGKDNFYLGGGYKIGQMTAIVGYAGFYLNNVNVEGVYLMPKVSSESVRWITSSQSWSGSSVQLVYDYSPSMAFGGSLGVGLHISKRLRITPQAGVMYYTIEGNLSSTKSDYGKYSIVESDRKVATWAMSGRGAARIELCPFNHITLVASPSYEKPVVMGSHATRLNESIDCINRWCGGFSVMAGVEIYF